MSFIPGMTGPISSGGKRKLTSISVIGSNYSEDTDTVAYPVGVPLQPGDVGVCFNYCTSENNGANPTTVIPAGYTSLFNQTGSTSEIDPPDSGKARAIVSYKILDGSESGTLLGMIENRREGMAILIVRGNIPATTVELAGENFQGFSNNPSEQDILSNLGVVPLLVFGWATREAAPAVFTKNTPAFGTLLDAPNRFIIGYTVYNVNPLMHEIDSDQGSGLYASLMGGYLQFS